MRVDPRPPWQRVPSATFSAPARSPLAGVVSSRRGLVGGLVGAVTLTLTGCGVRLDEDAPDLPFLPRRTKVSGEAALLDLIADTRALADQARASGSPLALTLADLHDTQATAVHDQLRASGVPTSVLDAPRPTPTASTGADPQVSLADAEGALLASDAFVGTAPEFAAPVLSILGQRAAARDLLLEAAGSAPAPPSTPPPATPGDPGATTVIGADALTALRRVAYLFQVIRPHAQEAEVGLIDRTSTWLGPTITAAEVALGAQAPPAVLGVPRPAPLDDPSAQRSAIAAALTAALTATGQDLEKVSRSSLRSGLHEFPPHLGTLVAWAYRWGVPLSAFPGLG